MRFVQTSCFVLVSTVVGAGLVAAIPAGMAAASSAPPGVVQGAAYGYYQSLKQGSTTEVTGPLVTAGTVCATAPASQQNEAATINYPGYAATGTVKSTAQTGFADGIITGTYASTVQNVNLFKGLITLTSGKAQVTVSGSSQTSSAVPSANFVGAHVTGANLSAQIGPNSEISVSGLGTVILNEQYTVTSGSGQTYAAVNLIDVHVSQNNSFGLLPGSQIIVGHASGQYTPISTGSLVESAAYGYSLVAAAGKGTVGSGATPYVSVGCTGGTVSNQVADLKDAAGHGSTLKTVANGSTTQSGASANSSASVQSLNLLGGAVTANAISAYATASASSGTDKRSTSVTFTNLHVAGTAVDAHVSPNSKITIPGFGYVVLNERVLGTSPNQATVSGLDVYITKKNALGLPVGTRIIVAHALAGTYAA